MEPPARSSVSLHNITETVPAEWNEEGERLCRVPAAVGAELNDGARDRVRHPTGSEIRLVPESDDATVDVTLSAPEATHVRVFWGVFQPREPIEVGPEPEPVTVGVPNRLADLSPEATSGSFDPRVCRIRFERRTPVALHGVDGGCRPPRESELPDTRYLAYGTSITEGASASALHTNYVEHVARALGYDALNLGCSGSAYCEEAMAEHVAGRDDWDVATLALSVNMANSAEFTPETFRERAETFVDTVAGAHPDKPVVCVTLFPYHDDLTRSGDGEHAAAYRTALREIVAGSAHENLYVVEGPDLLDPSGLTADLLHPGDAGMNAIGDGLADRLDALVE